MQERYGQCHGTTVFLHGGAGSQDTRYGALHRQATAALRQIAAAAQQEIGRGLAPIEVVMHCLQAMECDPQFNAGRGATLQADGQARLTASIMDGPRQRFSGVIGVTDVLHPSMLARHLQEASARVLTPPGTTLLARQLGLPVESPVTPERLRRWYEATASRLEAVDGCDTVGCVLRTADGQLFCGTSTGGRGGEVPGRVSDSATVAGTYCSRFAGISATGVGEELVDDALAARLETRRRDGASLQDASHRSFEEAWTQQRSYGWIALDREGFWALAHTTPSMSYLLLSSEDGEVAASAPQSSEGL
jgi:L-asparaginase